MLTNWSDEQLTNEFDRQITNLLDKGYPALAGMSATRFRAKLDRLSDRLADVAPSRTSAIPFVVVVTGDLVPVIPAIQAWRTNDKPGFTTMEADEIKRFGPIDTSRSRMRSPISRRTSRPAPTRSISPRTTRCH